MQGKHASCFMLQRQDDPTFGNPLRGHWKPMKHQEKQQFEVWEEVGLK